MTTLKNIFAVLLIIVLSFPYHFYFEKCPTHFLVSFAVPAEKQIETCCCDIGNTETCHPDLSSAEGNNINCNCLHLKVEDYDSIPPLHNNIFNSDYQPVFTFTKIIPFQPIIKGKKSTGFSSHFNPPDIFLQHSSFLI